MVLLIPSRTKAQEAKLVNKRKRGRLSSGKGTNLAKHVCFQTWMVEVAEAHASALLSTLSIVNPYELAPFFSI